MLPETNEAVEALYRSDWGRIVSALIRIFGDFDIAEDAAQEAFAAAVHQWRSEGVPEFPRAWIIRTARHKAIDRIRRQARFKDKLESLAASEDWKRTFPITTRTKSMMIGCVSSSPAAIHR